MILKICTIAKNTKDLEFIRDIERMEPYKFQKKYDTPNQELPADDDFSEEICSFEHDNKSYKIRNCPVQPIEINDIQYYGKNTLELYDENNELLQTETYTYIDVITEKPVVLYTNGLECYIILCRKTKIEYKHALNQCPECGKSVTLTVKIPYSIEIKDDERKQLYTENEMKELMELELNLNKNIYECRCDHCGTKDIRIRMITDRNGNKNFIFTTAK